jgi:imidazolonepropionase-like amidohydrolase
MTLAIRAARLLPDSASPLIQDGVVVLKGDRIDLVGPWDKFEDHVYKNNITVKDLGDVTLMPGLFDCHVCLPVLSCLFPAIDICGLRG